MAVSTYFREGKRSLISFRCASRSFLICASISSLRACPSLSTFDCKGVKVINARREEVEGVMDDGQGERLEEFKKGEGKWVGKDQSVRFPQEVRKAAFIPPLCQLVLREKAEDARSMDPVPSLYSHATPVKSVICALQMKQRSLHKPPLTTLSLPPPTSPLLLLCHPLADP